MGESSNMGAKKVSVLFLNGYRSSLPGRKTKFLGAKLEKLGLEYIFYDHFGCGKSEQEKLADATLSHWLHDAFFFLDRLTSPVLVVGSSLGGWLMFHMALRQPEKICGLIGVSCAIDYTRDIRKQLSGAQLYDLCEMGRCERESKYCATPDPISLQLINDA
eukprot:Sdes_comp17094_c0_seq1m6267